MSVVRNPDPDVPPYFCAGESCPGYPYRASEIGHPASCVRTAAENLTALRTSFRTADEARALAERNRTACSVALEEAALAFGQADAELGAAQRVWEEAWRLLSAEEDKVLPFDESASS